MSGWFRIDRKLLGSRIWKEPVTFRLYVWLLANAAFQEGRELEGYEVQKGEFIRSYSKLAEDLAYREGRGLKQLSKSTVKRSVDSLVNEGFISVRETGFGTVFTVVARPADNEKPFGERSGNVSRTFAEQKEEGKKERREKKEAKADFFQLLSGWKREGEKKCTTHM